MIAWNRNCFRWNNKNSYHEEQMLGATGFSHLVGNRFLHRSSLHYWIYCHEYMPFPQHDIYLYRQKYTRSSCHTCLLETYLLVNKRTDILTGWRRTARLLCIWTLGMAGHVYRDHKRWDTWDKRRTPTETSFVFDDCEIVIGVSGDTYPFLMTAHIVVGANVSRGWMTDADVKLLAVVMIRKESVFTASEWQLASFGGRGAAQAVVAVRGLGSWSAQWYTPSSKISPLGRPTQISSL